MLICESEFIRPDPKNPDYSTHEVDVYGHLPYVLGKETKQHRLSVRKNLKNNTFEAYRHFWARKPPQDEVASTGTLVEVIDFVNAEVVREWGEHFANQDQACDHDKVLSRYCQIRRKQQCPMST